MFCKIEVGLGFFIVLFSYRCRGNWVYLFIGLVIRVRFNKLVVMGEIFIFLVYLYRLLKFIFLVKVEMVIIFMSSKIFFICLVKKVFLVVVIIRGWVY